VVALDSHAPLVIRPEPLIQGRGSLFLGFEAKLVIYAQGMRADEAETADALAYLVGWLMINTGVAGFVIGSVEALGGG
jgi:hypothetical protein